jgi:precorrin-2 dehydrogenase/sirohydrochlorin ferrochelatase
MSALFPIFLKLQRRTVLVVGAGKIGESKIHGLLENGAQVRVVSMEATHTVQEWARTGLIELQLRAFLAKDLEDVFLVVVATASAELNREIFERAAMKNILCNVVDVPHLCDFYYPAVVRRGNLQIAVSTAGQSPVLAQRIRQQLEKQYGPAYAEWVAELGRTRQEILKSNLPSEDKGELLRSLASYEAFEAAVKRNSETQEKGEAV